MTGTARLGVPLDFFARKFKVGAEKIVHWCRENMASFKIPKRVVFGPLPKTSTGKIQKFVLREQAKGL